jgi:hypothetical protein
VSFVGAAERMIRALVFACVYSLFVYISSPSNSQYGGTLVCIMRASAASVWVLGAALPLLLFALPQCGIAIWARLRCDDEDVARMPLFTNAKTKLGFMPSPTYNQLATRTPPPEQDFESNDGDTLAETVSNGGHTAPIPSLSPHQSNSSPAAAATAALATPTSLLSRNMGPLTFKPVNVASTCQATHNHASGAIASKERMAEIAASLSDDPNV